MRYVVCLYLCLGIGCSRTNLDREKVADREDATSKDWSPMPLLASGDAECPEAPRASLCEDVWSTDGFILATILDVEAVWSPLRPAPPGENLDLCVLLDPAVRVTLGDVQVLAGPRIIPETIVTTFGAVLTQEWEQSIESIYPSTEFVSDTPIFSAGEKIILPVFYSHVTDSFAVMSNLLPRVVNGIVELPDLTRNCFENPPEGQSMPVDEFIAVVSSCMDSPVAEQRRLSSAGVLDGDRFGPDFYSARCLLLGAPGDPPPEGGEGEGE